MSIVNDVLRNIEQRKQSISISSDSAVYYKTDNSKPFYYWLALIVSVIISMGLIVFTVMQYQINGNDFSQDLLTLPEDLFIVSEEGMVNAGYEKSEIDAIKSLETTDNVSSISGIPEPVIDQPLLTNTKDKPANPLPKNITTDTSRLSRQPASSSQNSASSQVVANETVSSKATENVVAALNSRDINSVESQVKLASLKVQNDVKIRRMMKNNPDQVMPYLKNNFTNFSKTPSILALAAQGEQRSGNHINAIQIYKKLIPLQPKDARWRAGLAISLEAIGDTARAQNLYQLALSMNNLPASLRRFSTSRLSSINK